MEEESGKLMTVPRWEQIPFLVHGFGNREWKRSNFRKNPVLMKFEAIFLRQIHSDIVHRVQDKSEGKKKGDAMLTDRHGLLLIVKTADCLPVLIADKNGRAVAAAHCGWRSTSQRLIQKVVDKLKKSFGCDPSSLLVAFGPSIGGGCYEVGEEVKKEFRRSGLDGNAFRSQPLHKDKYLLDLQLSNWHQLKEKGVRDSNLFTVDACTHCEKKFLSYRRDGEIKERMYSFIGLLN
jgi:YfiH family protein